MRVIDTMDIAIKEAVKNSELRKFIRFANELYRDNPYWVPFPQKVEMALLRRDKNPAHQYCETRYFLAYRGDQVVGRVAAILNHAYVEKWNQNYVRFGWLECINDKQVSAALIHAVEKWAKEKGAEAVHGPLGFTDFDRNGFLVEGFNRVGTLVANYTHPYYPEHMDALGYSKDHDWLAFEIRVPEKDDEGITSRAEQILKENHLHLLKIKNRREMLLYTDQIFSVVNEAYRQKYGAVTLSNDQIRAYMNYFFPLSNPLFIPVVLDANDRVVAFSISYPSFSKALQKCDGKMSPVGVFQMIQASRTNDRAELLLHGVIDEYAGKGLSVVLMNEMIKGFREFGIQLVESNPEMEDDQKVQVQWKAFAKRQHKRRRCYIKQLV
jgi:hypothetical protein